MRSQDGAWGDALAELEIRIECFRAAGGPDAVDARRDKGRPTVRDQFDALAHNGTFAEVGRPAGRAYDDDGKLVSDDPAATRARLELEYQQVTSPFRTAAVFREEGIIGPADTRPALCSWVKGAYRAMGSGQDLATPTATISGIPA